MNFKGFAGVTVSFGNTKKKNITATSLHPTVNVAQAAK